MTVASHLHLHHTYHLEELSILEAVDVPAPVQKLMPTTQSKNEKDAGSTREWEP